MVEGSNNNPSGNPDEEHEEDVWAPLEEAPTRMRFVEDADPKDAHDEPPTRERSLDTSEATASEEPPTNLINLPAETTGNRSAVPEPHVTPALTETFERESGANAMLTRAFDRDGPADRDLPQGEQPRGRDPRVGTRAFEDSQNASPAAVAVGRHEGLLEQVPAAEQGGGKPHPWMGVVSPPSAVQAPSRAVAPAARAARAQRGASNVRFPLPLTQWAIAGVAIAGFAGLAFALAAEPAPVTVPTTSAPPLVPAAAQSAPGQQPAPTPDEPKAQPAGTPQAPVEPPRAAEPSPPPAPPRQAVSSAAVDRAVDVLLEGHLSEALEHYRGLARAYPDREAFRVMESILRRRLKTQCRYGLGPDGLPCDASE